MRNFHRYFGLIFGVQFLFWTLGGIYFSWSNLDEVHGDFERKEPPPLRMAGSWVSPDTLLKRHAGTHPPVSIESIKVVNFLGQPLYQILYAKQEEPGNPGSARTLTLLAEAETGKVRPPLTQDEAVELARSHFKGDAAVKKVVYLTGTGRHHEYRKNPLPAYAVSFANKNQTTVYVASELGVVQKFRNRPWRIFDFLWMLHTMDYASRDNFNTWILRIFSVLGLLTILSGFGLYFLKPRLKVAAFTDPDRL